MSREEKAIIEAKFKTVEKFYSTRLNPPLRYDSDKIPLHVAFNAMDEYAKQQSIEFFSFNLKIVGGYAALIKAAKEAADKISLEALDDFLKEYETATLEERYSMFLDHQLKQQV